MSTRENIRLIARTPSPLQLSSRIHFAKVEDKKSYCEKLGVKTYQLEFSTTHHW